MRKRDGRVAAAHMPVARRDDMASTAMVVALLDITTHVFDCRRLLLLCRRVDISSSAYHCNVSMRGQFIINIWRIEWRRVKIFGLTRRYQVDDYQVTTLRSARALLV